MIPELIQQAKALLIFNQDSVVFMVTEDEQTFIKQIDVPSLIKTIGQTDFQSDWYLEYPLNLHKVCQQEGKVLTISSALPSIYLLKFEGFSLRVPLPGAVIVHCHQKLWVYAYKDRLNLDSVLYQFPLPNISPTGQVCWGNVSQSSQCIATVWNSFITSKFNQDYDEGKSQAYPYNIVIQLKEIAQSLDCVYPQQDLIQTSLTLSSLAQIDKFF